jgi:hypothetical protein
MDEHLPGGDLIQAGLDDLREGRRTAAAWLVSIGAPRLKQGGIEVAQALPDPEHGLYALLSRDDPDAAHGRYNALVRRLVSFERALTCAS